MAEFMDLSQRRESRDSGTHQHLHEVASAQAFRDACEKLSQKGQRLTKPRLEVLRILADTHEHLSADQIAEQLHASGHSIHRATVYRTLESLEELQMLRVSTGAGGSSSYHLSTLPSTSEHVHLRCCRCAEVNAIDLEIFEQLRNTVLEQTGILIDLNRSDFVGVCVACQKQSDVE